MKLLKVQIRRVLQEILIESRSTISIQFGVQKPFNLLLAAQHNQLSSVVNEVNNHEHYSPTLQEKLQLKQNLEVVVVLMLPIN
jgi:hypothetical protein